MKLLKGSLHTTIFSKYTKLLHFKKYFQNILKLFLKYFRNKRFLKQKSNLMQKMRQSLKNGGHR